MPGSAGARGLGLLVAGVAITAVAAIRFVKNAKDIASDEVKSNKGRGVDIALAILLVLLGLALAVYLSHALIVGYVSRARSEPAAAPEPRIGPNAHSPG